MIAKAKQPFEHLTPEELVRLLEHLSNIVRRHGELMQDYELPRTQDHTTVKARLPLN